VKGFVYQDRLRPAAELDGSGNVVSLFVYGDSALARSRNGSTTMPSVK
jgi:hypothetical protein